MTTAADPQSQLLLKASVVVFLFRAMAGARTSARRQEVSTQLLGLLSEFVPFADGLILLGQSEEDLAQQFADQELWAGLRNQGPIETAETTAVPLYANGELTGAVILHQAPTGILDTLSAVASLASVAIESIREVQRLREDCAALEHRLTGCGGILGKSVTISRRLTFLVAVRGSSSSVKCKTFTRL